MLLVKTTLAPSKIHGLGVFADEHIRAGQVVWRFDPLLDLKIPRLAVEGLLPITQKYIDRHGYINPALATAVIMCFDDARFLNFADPPNLILSTRCNDGENDLVARYDIAPWVELTVGAETDADYRRKLNLTHC